MTITIYIKSSATQDQIAAIETLIDDTVSRDVNWNGAEPEIQTGSDFTYIDGGNFIASTKLFRKIHKILNPNEVRMRPKADGESEARREVHSQLLEQYSRGRQVPIVK